MASGVRYRVWCTICRTYIGMTPDRLAAQKMARIHGHKCVVREK